MKETGLWKTRDEDAFDNDDIVEIVLKEYPADTCLVLSDAFNNRITIGIGAFKDMTKTVLSKLKAREESEE